MPVDDHDIAYISRRENSLTKLKKQAAATVLQQYSLLVLKSVQECESPARTRLKMLQTLTDLHPRSPLPRVSSNPSNL